MQLSRVTWASAREVTAPRSPGLPSDSRSDTSCQRFRASSERRMEPVALADSNDVRMREESEERSLSDRFPPSGRHLDRLTQHHRNLLANPLAASVASR